MRYPARILGLVMGLAVAASMASASSNSIGPGSPAPALDVKTWYKGTPVKELSETGTYVVEFWATWCGPCRTTIPHLTELAKKNPDVKFLGISIWEDDDGTNIKKFVEEMGAKMDYIVGYSGNQTGMAQTWMRAAAQNGIPAAFIVKNRTIQWIGHPMEMDQPLAEVKAGTFDLAKFKAEFDREAEATRQQMAARERIAAAQKLFTDGKRAEARTALAEVEKEFPAAKAAAEDVRFGWLAAEDRAGWMKQAVAMVKTKEMDALARVYNIMMQQTRPNGDKAFGAQIADMLVRETESKHFVAAYYAAMYSSRAQDWKRAATFAELAQQLFATSEFKDNAQLKQAIDKMVSDAKTKSQG